MLRTFRLGEDHFWSISRRGAVLTVSHGKVGGKPQVQEVRLRDEIDYEPPLGLLGRFTAPLTVIPRLRRMFDYRHLVTQRELRKIREPTARTEG